MREGDAELVRRATSGDREAFGRLSERHQRIVFRFLAGLLGDTDAAEELTQETLVRAFQRIGDLQDPERVRPWLTAIARNLARQHFRNRRREPVQGVDPQFPAPAADPPDDDRLVALTAALARLKPAHREVLLLFEVEGLSCAEIAAVTGDSEPAIRSRLMRARRRLQQMMRNV